MKKPYIIAAALVLLISLAGCADNPQPHDDMDNPQQSESSAVSQTTAFSETDSTTSLLAGEKSESSTGSQQPEESQQTAHTPATKESESQAQPTAPSHSSSNPPAANPAQTQKPASTTQDTEPVEPAHPPAQAEPPQKTETPTLPWVTQPPKSFTPADHDRIIAEVTAYAESYKEKGFTFEWLDSMEFGWEVGYMGTPRINRDGVDGVIEMLKYHVDKIVSTSTDPANGITTEYMTYKVVQIEIDGGIAYAVIYGG